MGRRSRASAIIRLSLSFLSESHIREQTFPSPLLLQKIRKMGNGVDTIDSFSLPRIKLFVPVTVNYENGNASDAGAMSELGASR